MEIRLLKYFLYVAEELHFTKAAEKLGISQPTLSHQIRLLESQLDTVLFDRNGKRVELTKSGQILIEHAKRIIYEIDKAKTNIKEIEKTEFAELKVGTSGNHLVYSTLLSFNKTYPNIKVSIFDVKMEETIQNILNASFDLGVIFLPVNHSLIDTFPLLASELCAVMSQQHPLSSKETISLKELESQSLFLFPENYFISQLIQKHCINNGITLNPAIIVSEMHSLLNMITLSNGITILPKFYVSHKDNLPIKIIDIKDPMPQMEIGVAYRKGSYLSSHIQNFIKHLQRAYKDLKAPIFPE